MKATLICKSSTRSTNFESKEYPKEHIEKSVDILQEELDNYFTNVPRLDNLFRDKGVMVKFVDYDMQRGCVLTERNIYMCVDIDGINYFGTDIMVEWRKCIGISAFAHELLHTVEKKMYNVILSNHQGPLFNDNMQNRNESIENIVKRRIYYEVCSE
jgi:hypothetical protein